MYKWFSIPLIFLAISGFALAHEGEAQESPIINTLPDPVILMSYSLILLLFVVIISLMLQKRFGGKTGKILFILIVILVLIPTGYSTYHTIYLNLISETGGPVHWHADFQIWECGERVKLPDPESVWENKVGTSTLHHHADDRIHVEGILLKKSDADLHSFFNAIGGDLTAGSISVPEENGAKTLKNGDLCEDQPGKLKIYVNGKLLKDSPYKYILSPYENVPPGDCIIIDFSPAEEQATDKICESLSERGLVYDVYEKV